MSVRGTIIDLRTGTRGGTVFGKNFLRYVVASFTIAIVLAIIGAQVSLAYTPPSNTVTFDGHVYYSGSYSPYSGATVDIYYPSGSLSPTYEVTTDSSGYYYAGGAFTGKAGYRVIAHLSAPDTTSPAATGTVANAVGSQLYSNDLTLPVVEPTPTAVPTVTFTGHVTQGGLPVAAGVWAVEPDAGRMTVGTGESDSSGYYCFNSAAFITRPCDIELQAQILHGSMMSQVYTVHVTPGDTITQDIVISTPTPTAAPTVTPTATASPGASTITVSGYVTRGGSPVYASVGVSTSASSDSSFVYSNATTGFYNCTISASGPVQVFLTPYQLPEGIYGEPYHLGTLSPGASVTQNLEVPLHIVTFRARVLNHGSPVAGAMLYYQYGNLASGTTNSDGTLETIKGYVSGQQAQIYCEYGGQRSPTFTVTPSQDSTVTHDFDIGTTTALTATPTPVSPTSTQAAMAATPSAGSTAVTPSQAPVASGSATVSPSASPTAAASAEASAKASPTPEAGHPSPAPSAASSGAISPIVYTLAGMGVMAIFVVLIGGAYLLLKRK